MLYSGGMEDRENNAPVSQNKDDKNDARNKDDTEKPAGVMHVSDSESASHTQVDLTEEQVRQGHTGDHLRYILIASIIGVVAVFIVAYLYFMR